MPSQILRSFAMKTNVLCLAVGVLISVVGVAARAQQTAPTPKKVVFIAGKPSHGYGAHEHNAGCQLLCRELQLALPAVFGQCEVHLNGWPSTNYSFEGVDCIVMYCDGGAG